MPTTDLEQALLELVNDARLNPIGNAARYISSFSPLTATQPNIQTNLNFFNVTGAALQSALSSLTPVEPLAFREELAVAARSHDNAMIAANQQSHQLPGEPDPGARMANAGYAPANTFAWAENIFASTSDPLQAHAGFMVDWGPGPDGMQSPPGHRINIMDPNFRVVGIGIVQTAVQSNVGPLVVTEDFASLTNSQSFVYLLGVAFSDSDHNNFYSAGEGTSGLTVAAGPGSQSATSSSSGGYGLQIATSSGIQPITLSGGGLASPVLMQANLVGGHNYKIDVVGGTTLRTSISATISGPISNVVGLGVAGLSLATGDGDQSFFGTIANDTLSGGAGTDSVVFSTVRAAYALADLGGGSVRVTGPDGTDTLISIERLVFTDQTMIIGINDQPPIITSNGGGELATSSVPENGSAVVTTVTATDPDPGTTFVFSIVGGSDAAAFRIDPNTGVLSFLDTPDFEPHADSDGNNSFLVQISVSDGVLTDIQTLTVNVTNVSDPGQSLLGDAGPNTLIGGNGADQIDGQAGNDTLAGGLGSDVIFSGAGNDNASGGSGVDLINGQDGDDTLFGDGGGDVLSGGNGNDVILGGTGNDLVSGDAGDDRINAGDGNDVVFGGAGNDEIGGGAGDDTIVGQDGNDVIFGEEGNDTANAGAGADVMVGGVGNDTFGGGADNDILIGADGDDLLFGEDGVDNINGEYGNDGVVGGAGNDILGGGAGNDIVVGDDGDDVLFGETGNDAMNGGFGNDILIGSDGGDVIGGGAGDDDLNGGFGDDTIFGENGNDILNGSAGNDVLIGGGNDDVFVFGPGDDADTIADFSAGAPEDRIWFVGADLHSFADVQSHATTVSGNAVITYNGFFTVTLNGVTAGQLTAGDFIFA